MLCNVSETLTTQQASATFGLCHVHTEFGSYPFLLSFSRAVRASATRKYVIKGAGTRICTGVTGISLNYTKIKVYTR